MNYPLCDDQVDDHVSVETTCLFPLMLLLLLLPTLLTERCLIALQIDRGTTLKRCSGVRISTR